LTGDKSWRVRLCLSKIFTDLAQVLGPEISDSSLFSIFSTLLRDLENEVRIQSVKTLVDLVKVLNYEKIIATLSLLN
jgi:hypothetical protein